jgi:hypothetical protein
MDLESPAGFFRRFVDRRPQDDADPADMGTAYGLEQSLGPVTSYASDPEVAVASEPAGAGPMAWLARRLRRPR